MVNTGVDLHNRAMTRHQIIPRCFVVGLIAISLYMDLGSPLIVPLLFLLVVPFEKLFPRHEQKLRRPLIGLDLAYALSQPLLAAATLAAGFVVAIVSLFWLPGMLVAPLVSPLGLTAQLIFGFFVMDALIYWVHRWSHEVPFLWRFHSVHHSIETMDWISAFRNHPIDGLIIAPPVAFMLAAGFSLETTSILTVLQIATGIFLHANVRWRWKPLQRIIITPDFHHWHHANEQDAINSNYSVFLPLWDIAFGTWFMPPDRRPAIYGVDEHVPSTMAAQMVYPFRGLKNPTWMLRHPIRGARYTLAGLQRGIGQIVASLRRPRRPFHTPSAPPLPPTFIPPPPPRWATPTSLRHGSHEQVTIG